jgi:hypothetical protein
MTLGIYEDYGTLTCGGYPGSLGHLKTDAQTFAKWRTDYLKLDGCYANTTDYDTGVVEYEEYLTCSIIRLS